MIELAARIKDVEEYYFSKKLAEVRSLDTAELPVINLGIGSPDLAPNKAAIDSLTITAQKANSHGYQNYKGIPALREAIQKFYQTTYRVSLNTETEILPLMGSKEGIMHITLAFVNEGDEVLIPNPGYPTYASVSKLAGAKVMTYELKESLDWGIDMEALRKKDLSRVKIMWVNFPHMPTGRIASRVEMSELVELARENNFLIVNDNPYSLILNDAPLSILSIDGAGEVALELNSLSKSHNMAGWRIGWVAGNKNYVDAVLRVKSNMDSGMFLGLQQAAVESLKNGADWFNQLNDIYKMRKVAASRILEKLGCTFSKNQSGLFIWAKAPDTVADVEKWIDEILYGTKVFITPGFIFGDAGKRHIRISLCAAEEKLNEAYIRVEKFMKELKQTPTGVEA
jgi:LL-diaminopimelate aminotransferase